jgi:hypothetical protein
MSISLGHEFMNLLKHLSLVACELSDEESLSAEAREKLLELWRQINFAEGYGENE